MNIDEYSPSGGDIVGADNQLHNVVDLLGGGTPVNATVYDHTMFAPKGGIIIGSDNRAYDLVELLQNAGSGSHNQRAQYGAYWDGGSSTVLTRLGDAAEMNAADYTVPNGNDFDKVTPWADMYLCNLDNMGNEVARYGEPGFSFEGDCVPYAYKVPVMVHIPAFYYKVVYRNPGREWWIAPAPSTGFTLHPAFTDDHGEQTCNGVYIGAKLAGTETIDGKDCLTSASGEWSTFGIGRQTFRTRARNRGANWAQADFTTWSALQMLFLVEFANTNSQAVLGDGISSKRYNKDDTATVAEEQANRVIVGNAAAAARYVGEAVYIGAALGSHVADKRRIITAITDYDADHKALEFDGDPMDIAVGAIVWCAARPTGDVDGIGNMSGHAPQDSTLNRCQVVYRGLEGFHGNAFTNIDGCNIRDREWFVCYDQDKYADDVFTAEAGYYSIGTTPDTDGYIKNFVFSETAPYSMIPGEVGGASSSYVPDYLWQATGNRAPRVGGYAHNGAYDGAWFWNAYYAASYGYWIYGGRLLYRKPL